MRVLLTKAREDQYQRREDALYDPDDEDYGKRHVREVHGDDVEMEICTAQRRGKENQEESERNESEPTRNEKMAEREMDERNERRPPEMKYECSKSRQLDPSLNVPTQAQPACASGEAVLKQRSPGTLSRMRWWTDGRINRANGEGTTTKLKPMCIVKLASTPAVADPGSWRGIDRCLDGCFYIWNWLPLGAVRDM